MKKTGIAAILCIAAIAVSGCSGQGSSEPLTTTTTVSTTETTAVTTEITAVTTTTAAPPLDDYVLTEGLVLEADEASVRDERCDLNLTNESKSAITYQQDYRLIDAATGQPVKIRNSMEEEKKNPQKIVPGETKTIHANWSGRYGRLPEGDYYYELLISTDNATGKRKVCRAEFTVVASVFTPTLKIDPATVTPHSLTLLVRNSDDAARTYGLVFRVYQAESGATQFRQVDQTAKKNKNYKLPAGGTLTLELDWKSGFGSLAPGAYYLEIDLLEDGAESARTYRADFEVT